jgi:hypothetical protein
MAFAVHGEFIILTTEDVRPLLEAIISKEIPLRRMRPDGTFGFIPPKDFDAFLKRQEMVFYIEKRVYDKELAPQTGQEDTAVHQETVRVSTPSEPAPRIQEAHSDALYTSKVQGARQATMQERVSLMQGHNSTMRQMIADGRRFDVHAIGETEKIFSDTICLNKASFEENAEGNADREGLTKLVTETTALVNNLLAMMAKGKSSYRDLANLEGIQTGSVTLDHMNRTLIRFISFLFFYNGYFQKYSTGLQRFRAYFGKSFAPYYSRITGGMQALSLEITFKEGITPVRERSAFVDYCVGGFLHDIGKMPNVDYHDGNSAYDPSMARRHVFDSYNLLVRSKLFSWGVVATGLLHHDYYNSPKGYRQTKTFQDKFVDRRGKARDITRTKHLISYNVLDVAYDNAYSFFPTKMIELVDVFDAMTDSGKHYRKTVMTPAEAIVEMKRCYLDVDHPGIDPVLFDIFVDFVSASGLVPEQMLAEETKILKQKAV